MLPRLTAALRLLLAPSYALYTPDTRRPGEGADAHPYRVAWANLTTEDAANLSQWARERQAEIPPAPAAPATV